MQSDAATPPKGSLDEDAGQSHKSWRVGDVVVPVEPSGFSDDEGDLFSDAFHERAFGPVQPQPARHTAARMGPDQPAARSSSTNDAFLDKYDESERRERVRACSPVANSSASALQLRPSSPLAPLLHPSSLKPCCVHDGAPEVSGHGAHGAEESNSAQQEQCPAQDESTVCDRCGRADFKNMQVHVLAFPRSVRLNKA